MSKLPDLPTDQLVPAAIDQDDVERLLRRARPEVARALQNALDDRAPQENDLLLLFGTSGDDLRALLATARLLTDSVGRGLATYVVNRNINFTNICYNRCRFCAYARPRTSPEAFFFSAPEILQQAQEAADLGATEVCIQAGLPPELDPSFYPRLCRLIRVTLPTMHIHSFSPQEIVFMARKAGNSIRVCLEELKEAGLGSLPGTSAEILDDQLRAKLSPRRISAGLWAEVISTAHDLGLPTTATIMYGHVEQPGHRVRHLLLLRKLALRSRAFTEFVPLSFVSSALPTRRQPRLVRNLTIPDILKMHAVARLALHRVIPNIQVSWVKEGPVVAQLCLRAGANDLGGTLISERISSSAGSQHGQMMTPAQLRACIRAAGFVPAQRNTLYRILSRFDDPLEDPVDPLDKAFPTASQPPVAADQLSP